MKTVYINKLQPEYKKYVLSREPGNFQDANNLALALWRRKNPEGIPLKPKSIFAIEAEFGLKQNSDMSEEKRQICINAIKNSRNKGQNSWQSGGFSNQSNSTSYRNKQQSKPTETRRKRRTDAIPSSAGSVTKQDIHKLSAEHKKAKENRCHGETRKLNPNYTTQNLCPRRPRKCG